MNGQSSFAVLSDSRLWAQRRNCTLLSQSSLWKKPESLTLNKLLMMKKFQNSLMSIKKSTKKKIYKKTYKKKMHLILPRLKVTRKPITRITTASPSRSLSKSLRTRSCRKRRRRWPRPLRDRRSPAIMPIMRVSQRVVKRSRERDLARRSNPTLCRLSLSQKVISLHQVARLKHPPTPLWRMLPPVRTQLSREGESGSTWSKLISRLK